MLYVFAFYYKYNYYLNNNTNKSVRITAGPQKEILLRATSGEFIADICLLITKETETINNCKEYKVNLIFIVINFILITLIFYTIILGKIHFCFLYRECRTKPYEIVFTTIGFLILIY